MGGQPVISHPDVHLTVRTCSWTSGCLPLSPPPPAAAALGQALGAAARLFHCLLEVPPAPAPPRLPWGGHSVSLPGSLESFCWRPHGRAVVRVWTLPSACGGHRGLQKWVHLEPGFFLQPRDWRNRRHVLMFKHPREELHRPLGCPFPAPTLSKPQEPAPHPPCTSTEPTAGPPQHTHTHSCAHTRTHVHLQSRSRGRRREGLCP